MRQESLWIQPWAWSTHNSLLASLCSSARGRTLRTSQNSKEQSIPRGGEMTSARGVGTFMIIDDYISPYSFLSSSSFFLLLRIWEDDRLACHDRYVTTYRTEKETSVVESSSACNNSFSLILYDNIVNKVYLPPKNCLQIRQTQIRPEMAWNHGYPMPLQRLMITGPSVAACQNCLFWGHEVSSNSQPLILSIADQLLYMYPMRESAAATVRRCWEDHISCGMIPLAGAPHLTLNSY